jgi:kinesin family protein C1
VLAAQAVAVAILVLGAHKTPIVAGYNVSLLAYGQTGAGKTHTMLGAEGEHRGIIPRSIEQILQTVKETKENGWQYTLQASFLEIYNETIRDLLVPPKELEGKDYTIRQGENGMQSVADLKLFPVETKEDVGALMATAEKHKTVKGTDMNERSSRSHTVFQLRITATRQLRGDGPKQTLHGSLNLVDLAGSERLAKSCATGDRLKETQAINKSLSALGDVFTAISKKQSHIPYRNSKLTFLLQPCLSGDGKALVLMALSPAEGSAHESLCTLRFSSLISQCELGKATKHVANEGSEDKALPASGLKRPTTAPSAGLAKKGRA